VAYYLARKLREKHPGIPVGIIGAYLGGAAAETFISRETLLQLPGFAGDTARLDTFMYRPEHYSGLPGNEILPNGNQVLFAKMDELFPLEYIPVSSEASEYHRANFDDSAWQDITLPDSWTVAGFNHAGIFWFRKTIDIPAQWAGKDIVLGIGAADKADETYFNGVKVGATGCYRRFDHFMSPRYYTIPGHLVKAGRNVIAVRVSSSASIATDGGLIGPEAAMKISCGEQSVTLAGNWKIKMEKDLGTIGVSFMQMLGPGAPQSLHMLYDNMIHPLIPYAMRGAVWYQGEADALCYSGCYDELLYALIDDWRTRWGQKDFDFIIIQLPGYQPVRDYQQHSTWAVIREAQRFVAVISGSSLIVTLRDGDVDDIHPRNKRPVGERAAEAAMHNWENDQVYQPPMPQICIAVKNNFIVTFDRDIACDDEIRTLMLAGSDGVYHPANGVIVNGRELHITSGAVTSPVSARYAWSNHPAAANLTDVSGNLISPFEIEISAKKPTERKIDYEQSRKSL
jgi:sialate O-acetylesterase